MSRQQTTRSTDDDIDGGKLRNDLLAGAPVTERRRDAGGMSTAVLEAGDGPPVALLHGQGGWAGIWLPVLPGLAATHRVVAPDLPGLGGSVVADGDLSAGRVLGWLAELIDHTCEQPPALVGLSLGGSIAARFAAEAPTRIASLTLLGAGGITGRVQPSPRVLAALVRQNARPSEANTVRLLRHLCADFDAVQQRMGPRRELLVRYLTHLARTPSIRQANRRLLRELGLPAIAGETLARIKAPVELVWGSRDRVVPVERAQLAAGRLGWPLHVIDNAGHLAVLDQPATVADAILSSIRHAA